ncbi:MAG: hypothetical protein ABW213_16400 [Tardiphaga sp.]
MAMIARGNAGGWIALSCRRVRVICAGGPTGEERQHVRFAARALACAVLLMVEVAAPNNSFSVRDQSDHCCPASQQQNITFFFSEIMVLSSHPASHEGRFAIVTDVDAGCGGRAGLQRG